MRLKNSTCTAASNCRVGRRSIKIGDLKSQSRPDHLFVVVVATTHGRTRMLGSKSTSKKPVLHCRPKTRKKKGQPKDPTTSDGWAFHPCSPCSTPSAIICLQHGLDLSAGDRGPSFHPLNAATVENNFVVHGSDLSYKRSSSAGIHHWPITVAGLGLGFPAEELGWQGVRRAKV